MAKRWVKCINAGEANSDLTNGKYYELLNLGSVATAIVDDSGRTGNYLQYRFSDPVNKIPNEERIRLRMEKLNV